MILNPFLSLFLLEDKGPFYDNDIITSPFGKEYKGRGRAPTLKPHWYLNLIDIETSALLMTIE